MDANLDNPVMNVLNFFTHFTDKAIEYPYLPGALMLSIIRKEEQISWSIAKTSSIETADVFKPQRMFFGEAFGIYGKSAIVRDQKNSIDNLIEDFHHIKLNKQLKNKLMEVWGKPRKIKELINAHNQKVYQILRKRLDVIKKVSQKYKVEIKDKVDKKTEDIWLETSIYPNLSNYKLVLHGLFNSIEAIREVYKNIYECEDRDQIYPRELRDQHLNNLILHLSMLYEILHKYLNKFIWKWITLSENPGLTGSQVTIFLNRGTHTEIKIFVSKEIGESPQMYNIKIWVKSPHIAAISTMDILKKAVTMDNQLYQMEKDLSIDQVKHTINLMLKHISNEI